MCSKSGSPDPSRLEVSDCAAALPVSVPGHTSHKHDDTPVKAAREEVPAPGHSSNVHTLVPLHLCPFVQLRLPELKGVILWGEIHFTPNLRS